MEAGDRNSIEQWIDCALSHYSDVEPRMGLENRVLERLQLRQEKTVWRRRWMLAFACVVLVAGVVGWLEYSSSNGQKTIAIHVAQQRQPVAKAVTAPREGGSGPSKVGRTQFHSRTKPALRDKGMEQPQLAQFPSPRPLSEQERLLEAYVRQFPAEAQLVAREQTERMQELEQLYANEDGKNLEQER